MAAGVDDGLAGGVSRVQAGINDVQWRRAPATVARLACAGHPLLGTMPPIGREGACVCTSRLEVLEAQQGKQVPLAADVRRTPVRCCPVSKGSYCAPRVWQAMQDLPVRSALGRREDTQGIVSPARVSRCVSWVSSRLPSYPRHSGLRTKGQGTVQYSVVTTEPSSTRSPFQAAGRGADNRTHPPPTGPSAPARRHALWLPPQWLLSAPSLAGYPPGPPQCDGQVRLVSRTNN